MKPLFDYDPDKSRRNKEQHGVDFVWAQDLWKTRHVIIPAKQVRDEMRHFILGKIDGRVYVAVFAHRAPAIRLISCHKADKKLARIYEGAPHEEEKD